jgi:hypothetical protein
MRGQLLTGRGTRPLRYDPAAARGDDDDDAHAPVLIPTGKIAGDHLAKYLGQRPEAVAASGGRLWHG